MVGGDRLKLALAGVSRGRSTENFPLIPVVIVARAIDDIAGVLATHMLALGIAAAVRRRNFVKWTTGATGQGKSCYGQRQTGSKH